LGLQPPTPPVSFEPHAVEPTTNTEQLQHIDKILHLHTSYGNTWNLQFCIYVNCCHCFETYH